MSGEIEELSQWWNEESEHPELEYEGEDEDPNTHNMAEDDSSQNEDEDEDDDDINDQYDEKMRSRRFRMTWQVL